MGENERNVLEEAVVNFDGWVVASAEGAVSPFKHEDDPEWTTHFFGSLLEEPSQKQSA